MYEEIKENIESKQPLSGYSSSVNSHYNRLIELVSAMRRIQKQNYHPCIFYQASKSIHLLAIIQF